MGEDGQVHFAEAAALTPQDLAAVLQQVRAWVFRCSPAPVISTKPVRTTWPAAPTAGGAPLHGGLYAMGLRCMLSHSIDLAIRRSNRLSAWVQWGGKSQT
jgi:hypothetical protein